MVDTVDTFVLATGRHRRIIRISNASDGTGESAVVKVDKSGLTNLDGLEPPFLILDKIEGNVDGMRVSLYFDHATDDEIGHFSGGHVCREYPGGMKDPTQNDSTGDILLTTTGHSSGDSYDLTLYLRLGR